MAISTEDVKALREETGISVMQCKKALEEADGDKEKALVILRKASAAAAEKKADRELGAGVVQAYVHATKEVGAMVRLSSETDFVAKNPEFVQLAYDIALHVAATNPKFVTRDEVKEEDVRAAREVFMKEVEGKPADLQEKILQGKLDSYLKEQVLLEQPFVKDPEHTVQELLNQATQKFGEKVGITSIARIAVR